jgi:hypothetical protein
MAPSHWTWPDIRAGEETSHRGEAAHAAGLSSGLLAASVRPGAAMASVNGATRFSCPIGCRDHFLADAHRSAPQPASRRRAPGPASDRYPSRPLADPGTRRRPGADPVGHGGLCPWRRPPACFVPRCRRARIHFGRARSRLETRLAGHEVFEAQVRAELRRHEKGVPCAQDGSPEVIGGVPAAPAPGAAIASLVEPVPDGRQGWDANERPARGVQLGRSFQMPEDDTDPAAPVVPGQLAHSSGGISPPVALATRRRVGDRRPAPAPRPGEVRPALQIPGKSRIRLAPTWLGTVRCRSSRLHTGEVMGALASSRTAPSSGGPVLRLLTIPFGRWPRS